jgi:hypothetical protein
VDVQWLPAIAQGVQQIGEGERNVLQASSAGKRSSSTDQIVWKAGKECLNFQNWSTGC